MGVLFAIVGLVFVVFAAVGLVVGSHAGWIYGHFGLAAGCWSYAAATSLGELREFVSRDASRRGAAFGGNAVLQVAAMAAIFGVLAYLSVRYPVQWDWTEAQLHSLSPASEDVVAQIDPAQPVDVLAFFLPGTEREALPLLDLYRYAAPDRVVVRVVDPNARPDLAQRHSITTNGVILVCDGPCDTASGTARVTDVSEQELTRAIRSVISEKRRVYFLTGHGEASTEDAESAGASQAREALEGENLEVESLLLASQEEVPEDAAAVIVAGANRTLFDRELEALDRYVRGGGSLLLLVDPIVVTNLEPQARAWGIGLGSDIIIDQQIQLFAGPQLGVEPVVVEYGEHPVTERFAGRITTFHLARSVIPGEGDGVVELVLTQPASWAESNIDRFVEQNIVDLDPDDRRGPLALAAARTFATQQGEGREGRLIVVGDSDFARNRYIASAANADLFLNMVSWLVGQEQFISIERKLPRASSVALTNEEFYNFRYLSLFVIPEAILLGGIVIWWRRRG